MRKRLPVVCRTRVSRRRAPSSPDTDAFRDAHAVGDRDQPADGEGDGAVWFRDYVAEGAGARVVQVRHDVDFAVAAPDGGAAEVLCAGEREG